MKLLILYDDDDDDDDDDGGDDEWNIVCSISSTQMLYCHCCPTVLLWHS